MENINLNNYTLLATGTQVPLYRIDDTHVNGYYPQLLTEVNLASIKYGVDPRAVLAIISQESNFGVGGSVASTKNLMQVGSGSFPTVLSALEAGIDNLIGWIQAKGTYPQALSYYNCGLAENADGSIAASCSGTTISPYAAGTLFLAFNGLSGSLANGYRGYYPTLGAHSFATVMHTATQNPNCFSPGYLCDSRSYRFGGGCMQISQMSL